MPKVKRIDYRKIKLNVKYRIFNDVVQLDVKNILRQISKLEKLDFKPNDNKILFQSYVHKNKISPHMFKVRCGTTVTGIKASIIPNKKISKNIFSENDNCSTRQKMTFDTVKPDRWSNESFIKYYDNLHSKFYGIRSIEASSNSKARKSPMSRIKEMIGAFDSIGLNRKELKEYIDWVFNNKASKITLSLGLLSSNSCMQEWMNFKKKGVNNDKEIDSEWK